MSNTSSTQEGVLVYEVWDAHVSIIVNSVLLLATSSTKVLIIEVALILYTNFRYFQKTDFLRTCFMCVCIWRSWIFMRTFIAGRAIFFVSFSWNILRY